MFALLKLIQSIIKTLHSDGTPGQVGAGIALGAALGLTPLMNVHNLVVVSLIVLLNVSFGGGMLGWALFVPVGFLLDPVFHRIGESLLTAPSLRPLWATWYNTPLVPYTNFNNTVVLGSVVAWLVLAIPIYFGAKVGVGRYRATIGERVRQSKLYKAVTASQVYNWYKLFPAELTMRIKIFRWKAIGPLLLLLLVIGILVVLFAEPVARDTTEEVSTELLGTQVDVGRLDLLPRQASVDLGALQVADPFEPRRNLVEADRIVLKLNPEALAEKKLVVERFALQGMRFGTTRKSPARPVSGKGFAPQALRAVRAWGQQFNVPILQLTPIDTIKQLVLNPAQLGTVKAAQGLLARTDSTRQALEQGFKAVDVRATVDSAQALADRLSKTDARKLGLDGTRQAIQSAQQSLKQLDASRKQVEGLQRNVTQGARLLGTGVTNLDEARQRDYAFARSLLKLPTFSAPDIGNAFFGKVSIDRFQQALYWAELARHYMPPGLLPREDAGPKRLRASGTTVRFPKEHSWPSFLVQLGQVDFTITDGLLKGAYAATVQGLTSEPALYGKPMLVSAKRDAPGSVIAGLDVGGVVDHRSAAVRDSVSAKLRGVKLPSFDIPGLPFRIAPGTGAANLNFALRGDRLLGRWSIASDQVAWALDSAGGPRSDLEQIVWRVVSGLKQLDVKAQVSGTIKAPKLSVRSNLDDAIAQRLKAVVGEEVAKAEALARAKVDSIVADKVEPVKQRVAAVQADATKRVADEQGRLDKVEADLQAQLKRLTAGVAPGIKLPKIKL